MVEWEVEWPFPNAWVAIVSIASSAAAAWAWSTQLTTISLDRPVAIKTIGASANDEKARVRLRREARAGARIRHPNVCHFYEIGEDDGVLFIAMELLEGESLAQRLTRGPLPVSETIGIALEILSALEALHGEKLVHRDLKPSNIFLTPYGVKILDFGLTLSEPAGVLDSRSTVSRLTQAGVAIGTPSYMAPEQLRAESIDARTDLFALGAVIYEMLMGARAFPGDTPMEVYHRTMYEMPPALAGSPAVGVVDHVIRRALAKTPADRYRAASEMAEDLRPARELEGTGQTQAHAMGRLIVLPFRVLRADPEIDFLGVSVPDAITNALTGLESLVVRSSAAATRFGTDALDLERVAEEADVDVVLTGNILRAGRPNCLRALLARQPARSVRRCGERRETVHRPGALWPRPGGRPALRSDLGSARTVPLAHRKRRTRPGREHSTG